jgi:hypothetical protein
MRKLWIYLPTLVLLSFTAQQLAQTQTQAEPTFALHIEETHQWDGPVPGSQIIQVQYTNISGVAQDDACVVTPWVYKMIVLRNGTQLERIKPKIQSAGTSQSNDDQTQTTMGANDQDGCHGVDEAIQPGKSVSFPLGVSFAYDMSEPGTYEVTVTREMFPCEIDHGPTIKSNTLTIVVPPASGSSSPQQ